MIVLVLTGGSSSFDGPDAIVHVHWMDKIGPKKIIRFDLYLNVPLAREGHYVGEFSIFHFFF